MSRPSSRLLHALRVGNFKAFADTQRIPLKPITLIFGPNSAGKSSFIHSLALAHEAQFGREKRSLWAISEMDNVSSSSRARA